MAHGMAHQFNNRLKIEVREKYIYNSKVPECIEPTVINTECLPSYNSLIFLI